MERAPPNPGGALGFCLSAGATRPDELQAFLALDLGERRVDRSGEARVVELDRDVVALGFACLLLPSGAKLNIAGQDPEVGSVIRGAFDPDDLGLDVEVKGLDGAGEAVFGSGERADGCHCRIPFQLLGPRPSRSRWLSIRPGTIGPHLTRPQRSGGRPWAEAFLASRGMGA